MPKLTEKEVLDLINDTRKLLNERVERAKREGEPDDQLAEMDDRLLEMQERIMNEGIAPSPKQ
jgi:t-SNARE complex subunit (syntaxin)